MLKTLQDKIKMVFSDLTFDKQRHLYFLEGENLPSTSKKVQGHEEEVDFEAILPWCAIKEKVTVDELRETWRQTNKTACDLGHDTHDFLEVYNGLQVPNNGHELAGINFLKDILKDYDIVVKEVRMYSRKYKYAGTADLLLRHRITGELVLADYKTNKDLFKTHGFLKAPFDYLEHHPYNKYQLQLSYYQIMLNEAGIHISDRIIVYLRADGTYKIYNLVDFTEYLKQHLESTKEVTNDYNW